MDFLFCFLFLMSIPIFAMNSNVTFSLSSFDSSKPILSTQLNTGTTIFITQNTNGSYLFTQLDSSGNIVQTLKTLNGTRSRELIQGLANGNFAFIWQETGDNGYDLKAQVYYNNLTEAGPENLYKTFQQSSSDNRIASMADGGFSVFYFDNIDSVSTFWTIYMQSFNSTGGKTLDEVTLPFSDYANYANTGPVLRLNNTEIFLVCKGALNKPYFALIDVQGNVTQSLALLDSNSGQDPWLDPNSVACQMKSGKIFLASMRDYTNANVNIGYYAIMWPNGTILVEKAQLSNNYSVGIETPRSICMKNGNVIVAWGLLNSSRNNESYSYFFTVIDDGGNILHQIYAFDTLGANDFMIGSFSDDSFYIAAKDSITTTIYVQFYNSSYQQIFVNGSCPSPAKAISIDKDSCVNPIASCLTYFSNGSCQSCETSKQVTIGLNGCAPIIGNCSSYSDDFKCHTCANNYTLTVGKIACANNISNCGNYTDSKLCSECINNTVLTLGNLTCANPIQDCSSYADFSLLCLSCINGKTLTVGNLSCTTPINNCTSYSDNDGLCQSCEFPLVVSKSKLFCVQPILNCLSYADNDTCLQCNSSTIITKNALNCSVPINNCQTYDDNNTCFECNNNTALTVMHLNCTTPISKCTSYSDSGICLQCNSSTILTKNALNCSFPINNCQTYDDNNTCFQCNNNTALTVMHLNCTTPISNCTSYSDSGICLQCNSSTILTQNALNCSIPINNCQTYYDNNTCFQCNNNTVPTAMRLNCTTPINNCTSYLDSDGVCQKCKSPMVLSNTKLSCVKAINYCVSITSQGTCLLCSNGMIPSYNKTACVFSISSCAQETDDSECLSCVFGKPSDDLTICQETSDDIQTMQSKLQTDSSNISVQNINFLSKDQNTTIDLVNNLNPNYTMGLDKSYIIFSTDNSSFKVNATSKKLSQNKNGASIVAKLNSLPSGKYSLKADLGFTKIDINNKEEGLPDYFTITYQPPVSFFVGTDAEIAAQYEKITQISFILNLSVGDIIAIVFSIFGSLLIIAFVFWLLGRKEKKKALGYSAPGEAMSPPYTTT